MTDSVATANGVAAPGHVACAAPPLRAAPLSELRKCLAEIVRTRSEQAVVLRDMAGLLATALQCPWFACFQPGAPGSTAGRLQVLVSPGQPLPPQLQSPLAETARRALTAEAAVVQSIGTDTKWFVAALPLTGASAPEVLLAVSTQPLTVSSVLPALELAGVHLALWYARRDLVHRESEARGAATVAELLGRLASSDDLEFACHTLVHELKSTIDCRQVVLGLSRHGARTCRVAAVSGAKQVDPRSERVRSFEAVLDEALLLGEVTSWPPCDAAQRHGLLAHKHLAESAGADCVVSGPIRDARGQVQGGWLFLGDPSPLQQARTMRLIQAAEPLVGSSLALLQRAEQGRIQKWTRNAGAALRQWWGRAILLSVLLLAAAMFLPWPYRVTCDCELQPVVRRYVAAPFDATLERSLVEPGDLVSQNQLLARIDGREVRWELAGVSAERTRAAKQRDGHMATHEFGSAELARYEMERLDLKRKLLEDRGAHLELRSPIDGMVIAGDLKKAEGVPLSVGQTLFEIAPLERMIVEIAVPEEDIRHVRTGMPAEIVLDAFPRQRLQGSLARIHPRAELKETEHVFVGEFDLDNPQQLLRPGMQGKATIVTTRHCVGWNLFHKPWEKLAYWMGW